MTRALLVVLWVAVLALALAAMLRGWRNRLRAQAGLPALPAVPDELDAALLGPASGLYVGTTFATSWQDRVLHDGLGERAEATATLYPSGLLLDRQGAAAVFVPRAALVGARLAAGLAGKVMGAGGLLAIAWRLGDAVLDTGFRADDKTVYPQWVRTLTALSDVSPRSETPLEPSLDDEIRHSTGNDGHATGKDSHATGNEGPE